MTLNDKTILVTGANRGIGKALVEALLKKDVKRVYAAARKASSLPNFGDTRVVPLELDRREVADPRRLAVGEALGAVGVAGRHRVAEPSPSDTEASMPAVAAPTRAAL